MPGCNVGRICVTDVRARRDWIDDQLGRVLEMVASRATSGGDSDDADDGTSGGGGGGAGSKRGGNGTKRTRRAHLIRARVVGICHKEGTKEGSYDLALWRRESADPEVCGRLLVLIVRASCKI